MSIMSSPLLGRDSQAPASQTAWVAGRKAVIVATVLAMQLPWMKPAMAMYQLPLLSTPSSSVLPNFVLTMDNSESMALHHLPESKTTINSIDVFLPGSNIVLLHPNPSGVQFYGSHTYLRSAVGTVTASTGDHCLTGFECQMRSPDINSIYYNPAVLYQPWRLASDPTQRMPAASFTKAYFDPLDTAKGFADLSAVSNGLAGTWCTSVSNGAPVCGVASPGFNPAIFYRLTDRDPREPTSYTKYDLNASATSKITWGGTFYPARKDCGSTCTLAQERQNFANWFTYYRSRVLLSKGAISEAFASVGHNLRLGWGFTSNAKSSNNALPDTSKTGDGWPTQGVKEFDTTHQRDFLSAIQTQTLNGSTPLRFSTAGVGSYFSRADAWSPWRSTPGNANSPILSCRRGAHILMTDGYYNDGPGDLAGDYTTSSLAVGEVDSATTIEVGSKTYPHTPSAPYADSANRNSLADIATRYWAVPLLPDSALSNAGEKVPPTLKDPAHWLHLNQFMVGLGVKGSLNYKANDPLPASVNWTNIPNTPANNTDPSKIDDMIHAAWNSRGEYFTANDGESLKQALIDAVRSGEAQVRTESGVATAGATAVAGDLIFIPRYDANDWSGDIHAATISGEGPTLRTRLAWRASDRIPAPADRNIFGYSTRENKAVPFTGPNFEHFDTIDPAYLKPAFIDFIRGVNSASTGYRQRSKKLPDFINSTPTIVANNLDMGYDDSPQPLPSGGSSYGNFLVSKGYRKPLLFVGGNGGMLHVFNGSANVDAGGGGEVFAYVPKGVQANLDLLAQNNYSHHFYVDGPLTEADAYLGATVGDEQRGAWHNLVIGTLGAGGRGVFAINVPLAGNANAKETPPLGATNVMWDKSDADIPSLGHVTSPVEVGYVQSSGGWYAFIGNGHESRDGVATLIVLNLADGSVAKVFELPDAAGVTAPNGLSGVTLIRNASKSVIGAYAGDLHGQVWRFEFEGSNPANWKVGFGNKPLFVARHTNNAVQKISAAPTYSEVRNATTVIGNLVLFGTGRLTESGDTQDRNIQSFYAVLDPTSGTQSPSTGPFADAATGDHRSKLQEQKFLEVVAGQTLLRLSREPVPLSTGPGGKLGWFIDLDFSSLNTPGLGSGQVDRPKVIYKPTVVRGLVFFTGVVPPTAREACTAQEGSVYTLIVPIRHGGQSLAPTWDTDGDGIITKGKDELGQGFMSRGNGGESRVRDTQDVDIGVDIAPSPEDGEGGTCVGKECGTLEIFNKCAAADLDTLECKDPKTGTLRPIYDRIWKRIVKPPF